MEEIIWVLQNLNPTDAIDIFIVALLIFGITFLFRGTQAVALFRGLVFVVAGLIVVAGLLQLQALGWLLSNGLTVLVIAIPVIFQPELRRVLEQLGRGGRLFSRALPDDVRVGIINEIVKASERLSERRHGALIVIQRNSNLDEYVATGMSLDSLVNAEILLTIFWPKTELHDGAVIINAAGRIAAGACVLPLTASRNLPNPKMGTRHRASLGISEVSDAVCVVISEETGKIAVTNGGRMVSRLDPERLRTILFAFYGPENYRRNPTVAYRLGEWWRSLVARWQRKPQA